MFPRRLNEIVEQLVRWGYSRYLVENMDRRRLLVCYGREKEKRINQNHINNSRQLADLEAIFSRHVQEGLFTKKQTP